MSITDIFHTQGPTLVQASFAPLTGEALKAQQQTVLSTYQGPGREKVLGWLERHGHVPTGVADAARTGTSPLDIGQAVSKAWQQQQLAGAGGAVEGGVGLGGSRAAANGGQMVTDAIESGAAVAAHTSSNPVYGGLMGQIYQSRGFMTYVDPAVAAQAAPQSVAGMLADAVDVAPEVAAGAGEAAGAATSAAVTETPELRSFVDNALSYIGTAANRSDVLRSTVETMTAHGQLDGVDSILARAIATAPADDSAPALLSALEHAGDPVVAAAEQAPAAAHAVAEAVAGASHVAPEALHGVSEAAHAAPEAAKVMEEVVHGLHPETLAAFTDSLAAALKLMRRF